LRKVLESKADILLFSVYIWNVELVREICSSIKKIRPECTVILGGPEASFDFERFFSFADYVMCGEGEGIIAPLVKSVMAGSVFESDYVARKDKPEASYHTVEDMDTLPFSYKGEDLSGLLDKLVYYESSRGCIYNCSYCLSCITKGTRFKSEERVMEELSYLRDAGVTLVKFCDRTFNSDKARAMRLMRRIADELHPMAAHFEMCADFFDEKWFEFLQSMPKDRFQFEIGIQSVNPNTLSAIHRKPDVWGAIEACRRIKSFGNIEIHADLIAALPHDTYDDVLSAVDAIYDVCDVLFLGRLKMLRGSPIRDTADSFGAKFEDTPPYSTLMTDTLSYDELMHLCDLSDVIDTYRNSLMFEKSLSYVLSGEESPARFFSDFTKYLSDIGALERPQTQEAWYGHLFEFAKDKVEDIHMFSEYLRLDWFKKSGRELKIFERIYDRDFKTRVKEYLSRNKDELSDILMHKDNDVREIIKRVKFIKTDLRGERIFMRIPDSLELIDVSDSF